MTEDCRKIRDLMDSYLGGELLVETNHQLQRHTSACEACRSELARRERLKSMLKTALRAPDDTEQLRMRIASAIDARQSRWRRAIRYSGVAAALLLGVALTMWRTQRVDAAAYIDTAENHVLCALTVPASATLNPARTQKNVAPEFMGLIDSVPHTPGGYDLVDAHMCPYHGRNYVHLVYRGHGRVLSLFAEPALRGVLPDAGGPTPERGYWVTAASARRFHLFLVSDAQASPPADVRASVLQGAAGFFDRSF